MIWIQVMNLKSGIRVFKYPWSALVCVHVHGYVLCNIHVLTYTYTNGISSSNDITPWINNLILVPGVSRVAEPSTEIETGPTEDFSMGDVIWSLFDVVWSVGSVGVSNWFNRFFSSCVWIRWWRQHRMMNNPLRTHNVGRLLHK